SRSIVHEGMSVLELCEKIERTIIELGGKPAFPCNVGINEVTAHYTPPINDPSRLPEGSIVKIDIGVHVEGYIADTAITVCFNKELLPLIKAVEESLDKAIKNLKPGIRNSDIGSIIQKTINDYGYKPIQNLTGHSIERYTLHAGKSIPNVSTLISSKIRVGEIYAIEPFATLSSGAGRVNDLKEAHIFKYIKEKGAKSQASKQLINYIRENFKTLPFTRRWLKKEFFDGKFDECFDELLTSKCVMAYPVLVEANRMPVAQAEHTVIVTSDGCEVIT
ncbi:MAG: type II methionyl aminopeptidase, partial [Candidatus Bathyarchaeia archaeon]